jgi:hypothetical protein
MNDRESEFGRKIARCLDRGVADLRPGTVYRLQQARRAALAAASPAHGTVPELATAGAHGGSAGRTGLRGGSIRWLGLALLVAAAAFGYQQWHSIAQVREFEDLDMHLLASDLPIDAYLDRGFQNWLRNGLER